MKQAIICSVSNNDVERNYCYLPLILLESIQATNPDTDVYCGILTDMPPEKEVIKELENRCNVVVDPKYKATGHRDYNMRVSTCDYFSNLLSRYDQLVYCDIDAVFTNKFTFKLPEHSFLHDTWPTWVQEEVEGYVPEFHTFPWLSIVNDSNRFVYADSNPKAFIENVKNSGLTLVPNDFTTYYSWRPYRPEHLAFHYDGFNYCGYAHKLMLLPFWSRLEPIVFKYFSFSDIKLNYWERRIKDNIRPL